MYIYCYLIQTCPTPESLTEWERFDGAVRCAMNDLLATSLTDTAWKQAELPVAVGGLGMRSAAKHASAA